MKKFTIFLLLIFMFGVGAFSSLLGIRWVDLKNFIFNEEPQNFVNQIIRPTLTPTPLPEDVSMVLVGDIMLSRSVGAQLTQINDFNWPFRLLNGYLNKFDLAFGNLESPVSDRGTKVGSIYSFRSDPRVAPTLASAGFDVMSIANNHIWDYGRIAFMDTLDNIKRAGMDYVGGGVNSDEAHAGVIRDTKGTKIGFLAYTNLAPKGTGATLISPGITNWGTEQIQKDIQAMRPSVDILVVSFHWGEEYKTVHNAVQESVATMAVRAGADFVVGHHPHVRQELVEVDEPKAWIAYSLGNFIFDQNFSVETMTGMAIELHIKNKKIDSVAEREINISNQYQASVK